MTKHVFGELKKELLCDKTLAREKYCKILNEIVCLMTLETALQDSEFDANSFVVPGLLKGIQVLAKIKTYHHFIGNISKFSKISKRMFYQVCRHLLGLRKFWAI